MGESELVSAYVCEACHETFSPEEGEAAGHFLDGRAGK
jgi:transposase-like protein